MSDRLRLGVISTSNIGRVAIVPAVRASRNVRVVAVASRSEPEARAFAAHAGIARHHASYQALLDDDQVDAVYNPLPNALHREWTIRAIEAGKHVLCEKPLGLSAAECLEMEAAAASGGVKLMEAFMYRFHPRTERVLDLIRTGAIGSVRAVRSAFTFRLTRPDNIRWSQPLGGGALMDVGCYCVNVSRTVVGAEPIEAQAWASWGSSGVDEQLAGSLRFTNGVVAQFDCALTMERHELYEIAGTTGCLRVPAAFVPGTADVVIEERHGRAQVAHAIGGADQYQLMVEHFADTVLRDTPLRYPASEAALNLRAIQALLDSARQGGQPVRL